MVEVSKIKFLKNKFNNDDFNSTLATLIHSCAFNNNLKPISWDKLEIFGYGVVKRTNRIVLNETMCDSYNPKVDDYQLLIIIDPTTNNCFGLVIPPYDDSFVIDSYIFENQDYCFPEIKKINLMGSSYLLTNNSNDQLLVDIYPLDDNHPKKQYALSSLIDQKFIGFSKFCCSLRIKNKYLDLNDAIDKYNKK